MRYSKVVLLSTLSTFAFLTAAASSQAFASPYSFGFLKQTGDWKVGPVDPSEGTLAYCAAMNQFSRDVVLAFSRTVDGKSSIAMDFKENLFKLGTSYEATLAAGRDPKRKFSARANSEHSVVVDIGQNDALYGALNEGANLDMEMSVVDATFVIRRLSGAYVSLLDCAASLHQGPKTTAAPVGEVEKTSLETMDTAMSEKMAQDRVAADEIGKQIEQLQKTIKDKGDVDKLAVQINEKTELQRKDSNEQIAELNRQQKELIEQLSQQRQKLAELEQRRNEQQETQELLKQAVESKDSEIARLQENVGQQDGRNLEDMSRREKDLAARVTELQKDRDDLRVQLESARKVLRDSEAAIALNKSLRENSSSKEEHLAAALKEQENKTAELTQKLTEANADYRIKLAAVQADREDMKKKADSAQTENASLKAAATATSSLHNEKLTSIESQMTVAMKAKEDLSVRLDAQEKQNKVLEAALSAKEQELAMARTISSGDNKRMADIQKELAVLREKDAAFVEKMQMELDKKTAQYDDLKKQFDMQEKMVSVVSSEMSAKMSAKEDEAARLEKMLAAVEAQRKFALENAAKVEAELSKKQDALASLMKQQEEKALEKERALQVVQANDRAKLAAAEAERDVLKKKLEDALAGHAPLVSDRAKLEETLAVTQAKLSALEVKMAAAAREKQELTDRLDAQEKHAKVQQAALEAKEQEWLSAKASSTGNDSRLMVLQNEMRDLKEANAASLKKLQSELEMKTEQYAVLEKKFDASSSLPPGSDDLSEKLAAKSAEVYRLEKTVADIEMQKKTAMEEAAKAKVELSAKQAELNELAQNRLRKSKDLEKNLEATSTDYRAQLESTQAELELMKKKLDSAMAENAPLKLTRDKAEADLAAAREKLSGLESQLASAQLQKKEMEDLLSKVSSKNPAEQNQISKDAVKTVEDLGAKKAEVSRLEQKLGDLEAQRKALVADALRAQVRLADLKMEQEKKSSEMDRKLVAAEKERDEMKKKLEGIVTENVPIKTDKDKAELDLMAAHKKQQDLEAQLTVAQQQKKELEERLAAGASLKKPDMPLDLTKMADDLAVRRADVARLEQKMDLVETQRKIAADDAARMRAQLDILKSEQEKKSAEMSRTLAVAQEERDTLKKKLSDVLAEGGSVLSEKNILESDLSKTKEKLSFLESQLSFATQQRDDLTRQLEKQNQQMKSLRETLTEKERELMSTKDASIKDGRKLAAIQSEMEKLKPEYVSVVKDLMTRLKDKAAQLMEANTQRQSVAEDALRAQAEVEQSHRALTELKNTVKQDKENLVKLEKDLRQKMAAIKKGANGKGLDQDLLSDEGAVSDLEESHARIKQLGKKMRESESGVDNLEEDLKTVGVKRKQKGVLSDSDVEEEPLFLLKDHKRRSGGEKGGPVVLGGKDSSGEDDTPETEKSTLGRAEAFLDKIMSYHRPESSLAAKRFDEIAETGPAEAEMLRADSLPKKDSSGAGKITLEKLLKDSGMPAAHFSPVEQTESSIISQWTFGRVTGMFEQTTDEGDFRRLVGSYLNRYRQDCGNRLKIRVSPPEIGTVGTTAVADIECAMPSNSYATSFLFLQDDNGFSTILYSAYPNEKDKVRGARDSIARTLKGSRGFEAPQVVKQATRESFALKLNVPPPPAPVEDVRAVETTDELETILIQ